MSHAAEFFVKVAEVAANIDLAKIETLAGELANLRDRGGRLFFIGVGGSAANCSHAVNDFRKLCGIEAYTPVDNVAELTAYTNDEGWHTVFERWLEGSHMNERDAIFVLSVGGGDVHRDISMNIVNAIYFAVKKANAKVFGIVGKKDGFTAQKGNCVIVVPEVAPQWVTPLSESFQSVVLHCLVSHPSLQQRKTKW